MKQLFSFIPNYRIILLLLLALGATGSYFVSRSVLKEEVVERQFRFNLAASNSALALRRVVEKTETMVRSIVSFYDSSDDVTRTDFLHFTVDAMENGPGIQALLWVPKIEEKKRTDLVNKVRREGYPEFEIRGRIASGSLVKSGPKDFYYPMLLAEPLAANVQSLGFDFGSEEISLNVMNHAARSNRWVATPRIQIKKGLTQTSAVLLFAPIYNFRSDEIKNIVNIANIEDSLQGFCLAVINIDKLMRSAFHDMKIEEKVSLYLYDMSDTKNAMPLSVWGGSAQMQPSVPLAQLKGRKEQFTIELGGRSWTLVAVDTEVGSGTYLAMITFFSMLFLTLLLTIFLYVHFNRHETIKQTVVKRTAELERHKNELEKLVTERTQVIEVQSEELKIALLQQKELNELQKKFISMTSHEFRTPLTIIDSAAQKLGRNAAKISEDMLQDRVKRIREAVTRMVKLIDRTLEASKMESGKYIYDPDYCNLSTILNDCCIRQQELSPDHKIRIIENELSENIYADANALEHVFSNLLSNAVKYSPSSPEISVEVKVENENVMISFTDQGLGVDEADIPKLGSRFFRAESSAGIQGTGIGLNLCNFLVEQHEGSIAISSKLSVGSTFTVILPVNGITTNEVVAQTVDEEPAYLSECLVH